MIKDIIIFEMANSHQGDVEHGLNIIKAMGREAVVQRIMSHIKEYSQGVLAKVIVECMK